MLRIATPLALVLCVAACGNDPDKPGTAAESRVAARAVADVDAAMADARRAPPPAPAPVALPVDANSAP